MIKILLLTTILNTGEITATEPDYIKIEARRRDKGQRGRRRGGNGLR